MVIGALPSLVYLTLFSYCHKNRYTAWPSLKRLSKELDLAKTTVIRQLNYLLKQGYITHIEPGKTGKQKHNIYHLLPPDQILASFSETGSEALPERFQKATGSGSDTLPQVVAQRYPNNNNLNKNKKTTTSVVVDFKKIKDQKKEKKKALRERMKEFEFRNSFTEKVLREYSIRKIEEKIELYAEGKAVRNKEGWLITALKEGYGEECENEEELSPSPSGKESVKNRSVFQDKINSPPDDITCEETKENKKILSREEALKRIQAIREEISL